MLVGPGDDRVDPRWAPLALRALLEDRPGRPGCVHVDVEGVEVTVTGSTRGRLVTSGHEGCADATVTASLPVVLAIVAGTMTLQTSGAVLSGDAAVAAELLDAGAEMRRYANAEPTAGR